MHGTSAFAPATTPFTDILIAGACAGSGNVAPE
jgi:hypothetical protein